MKRLLSCFLPLPFGGGMHSTPYQTVAATAMAMFPEQD